MVSKQLILSIIALAIGAAYWRVFHYGLHELPPSNFGPSPSLPSPDSSAPLLPTLHFPWLVANPQFTPKVPPGFVVTRFAKLEHPRWMHVLPNGDVLVAEARTPAFGSDKKGVIMTLIEFLMKQGGNVGHSANRITLLRDADNDGVPELRSAFLEGLNLPFGMALLNGNLYVANTDGLLQCPYVNGATRIERSSCKQVAVLPAGGYNHHWTRNVVVGDTNDKLLITVGSASNIGEYGMDEERQRACVLEYDIPTQKISIVTAGLRNPVGLARDPSANGAWWTVVNERDLLGDDLVPDYLTTVAPGLHYGWPWYYFGANDTRVTFPGAPRTPRTPDYALGSHTASLGLTFSSGLKFPAEFSGGAFIGQHGSWNRRQFSGYKVVFVRFENGKPVGGPVDFLTGFINDASTVFGRPVGVTVAGGCLLVADDSGDSIWRVCAK